MPVKELRLALTVEDYERALAFYRDTLGLPVLEAWSEPAGHVTLLDAGRATLELLDPEHAAAVDSLEVDDSAATADALEAAGAERLAGPVVTPWQHRNVRLVAPDGMQLTLFTVLEE